MNANRHKMAVASHLLLENDQGEVLFLRRNGTGYADGQWSVPAGHVDPGETLVEACIREAGEEIGIRLADADVRAALIQHKQDTDGEERIDIFFAAALPPAQMPIIAEPNECDALQWTAADAPPEPLVAYVRAALEAIGEGQGRFLNYFGFEGRG